MINEHSEVAVYNRLPYSRAMLLLDEQIIYFAVAQSLYQRPLYPDLLLSIRISRHLGI